MRNCSYGTGKIKIVVTQKKINLLIGLSFEATDCTQEMRDTADGNVIK
jgi:hypothetical protein